MNAEIITKLMQACANRSLYPADQRDKRVRDDLERILEENNIAARSDWACRRKDRRKSTRGADRRQSCE